MAEVHNSNSGTGSPSFGESVLSVTVVTPSGRSAEYNVRHIRIPGIEGDFGVLPGHIPFMTAMRVGSMIMDQGGEQKIWAVSGGFAEVLSGQVTILAETAEPADSIDLERAEAARQRATQRLQERENQQNFDVGRARAALAKAINRIDVARGTHHG